MLQLSQVSKRYGDTEVLAPTNLQVPSGETRVLNPGDAYYFTSAIPHRFRNTGSEACEIISASTPPTF